MKQTCKLCQRWTTVDWMPYHIADLSINIMICSACRDIADRLEDLMNEEGEYIE